MSVAVPAIAQTPIGVPDGFVGPEKVSASFPTIVSEQRWKRGDEALELVQDVPLGAMLPGVPLQTVSGPSCRTVMSTITNKIAQAGAKTHFIHTLIFSNVGGDYKVRYLRPELETLPDDVKAYMDAMCARWTTENALNVPASPPPTPALPAPPTGFLGGTFKPPVNALGVYSARWRRGSEVVYVVTLLRPIPPDPELEHGTIGTPATSTYEFLSRENAGRCASNAAQIINYSTRDATGLSYVHALYAAGSPPLLAAYTSAHSNAFPDDVRAYFGSLCAATIAAMPPGKDAVLPTVQQTKKNAPFVAPADWFPTFSAPTMASWQYRRGRIEATLLRGQWLANGSETELTRTIFYPVPLKFTTISPLLPCTDGARPSWIARYKALFTEGHTSEEVAVFRATPIGLMKIVYSRPADTPEDTSAIESLTAYCP